MTNLQPDEYPVFSQAEMTLRRRRVEVAMSEHQIDHLIVYGSNRSGTAVQWMTGWPVTREAALVRTRDERDALFLQFYNHVPNAERLASECDVSWGGASTIQSVIEEVSRRGGGRVGLIGPLGYKDHARVEAGFQATVDLDSTYTRLRLVKSSEEMEWMRRGSELSDRAIMAIRTHAHPGTDERELGAIVEAAYLPEGGTNHIHYFGVTSMEAPDRCVPSQWPSTRKLQPGDALTTEISASWWGYPGQVLRTMTVSSEPTTLYRELHDVAEAAFDAVCAVIRDGATSRDVVEAAGLIGDAGFTIYDDLVHGFGGGYLDPVIGRSLRMGGPEPDTVFQAGMTVVVQPNVTTIDSKAGVQTGGLVAVTTSGVETLQRSPRGLWHLD